MNINGVSSQRKWSKNAMKAEGEAEKVWGKELPYLRKF
jgi:hypothetical protein